MKGPNLRHVGHFDVAVAESIVITPTPHGLRRMVPILGGTVSGPIGAGIILPGGADFQIIEASGVARLEARYAIELDQGVRVAVHNIGLRHGSPKDMERLARGESVDSDLIYFRSAPVFEAPSPVYDWLNRSIFVATGIREPSRVLLDIFQVE